MTEQTNQLSHDLTIEAWKEELSRARKFREAIQKRSEEKQLQQEAETLQCRTQNTEYRRQNRGEPAARLRH